MLTAQFYIIQNNVQQQKIDCATNRQFFSPSAYILTYYLNRLFTMGKILIITGTDQPSKLGRNWVTPSLIKFRGEVKTIKETYSYFNWSTVQRFIPLSPSQFIYHIKTFINQSDENFPMFNELCRMILHLKDKVLILGLYLFQQGSK